MSCITQWAKFDVTLLRHASTAVVLNLECAVTRLMNDIYIRDTPSGIGKLLLK